MGYDKVVDGIEICEQNRFTNYVREKDKSSLRDLECWVQHFAKGGIKAVIGFSQHGYAVYRVGLEECPDE
jgi:hypothetical protein